MMSNLMPLFVATLAIARAGGYTATTEKAAPSMELNAAVRAALDADAITIHDDTKQTLMQFWFRSSLPSSATAQQLANGITYRELPETTLLAVVYVAKPFIDYRKQEIASGYYSLRVAFQPDTGDHKETAPHAEFVLLSPIAEETSLEPIDAKTLYERSRKATGGDHPGVMLLFPERRKLKSFSINKVGDDVQTLNLMRTIETSSESGVLGFAIAISGSSSKR